ncbi:sarcosine oxidase [Marine Group I thaumarchaeote]|nr:sarcosine oxidase [Marine Group I thaumarchaeote]
MTAITPLESIHKKGLFGDHHKKNESDLLKISEVKDLTVVQIVQYKRSKVQLSSIQIDGLEFSLQSTKVSSNKETRILWSAPSTWLVISRKENIVEIIKEKCNSDNFAITDISHSRTIIQIKGLQAKDILKKGCPLNFNEFENNNCAGSVFQGINIVVDFVGNNPDTFNLLTLRSFGESFYHHITDAALEFGYIGV